MVRSIKASAPYAQFGCGSPNGRERESQSPACPVTYRPPVVGPGELLRRRSDSDVGPLVRGPAGGSGIGGGRLVRANIEDELRVSALDLAGAQLVDERGRLGVDAQTSRTR